MRFAAESCADDLAAHRGNGRLTVISFVLGRLTIAPFSNPALLFFFIGTFTAQGFYRTVRPDRRLYAIAEASGQMLLILMLGILLTYAAVTANFPYVDAELYVIDNALGFDRRAYLTFFAQHHWLRRIVDFGYSSMLPQFATAAPVLYLCGHLERMQRLLVAVVVALLLTTLISVFTPSLTAFVYVDIPHLSHVPANIYE